MLNNATDVGESGASSSYLLANLLQFVFRVTLVIINHLLIYTSIYGMLN